MKEDVDVTEITLTGHHWLVVVFLRCLVTHPLLTAFPRDVDASWVRAVRGGQPDITGTCGNTADLSVHTHAVVLTAGLKGLSTAVDHSTQVTRLTLLSCRHKASIKHHHSLLMRKYRTDSYLKSKITELAIYLFIFLKVNNLIIWSNKIHQE